MCCLPVERLRRVSGEDLEAGVTSPRADSAIRAGTLADAGVPKPGHARGEWGFWITFAVGWLAYLGLMSAGAILENQSPLPIILMTASPALLSVPN
jgi:hypothetical protein